MLRKVNFFCAAMWVIFCNFSIASPLKSGIESESLCKRTAKSLLGQTEKDLFSKYNIKKSEIHPDKLLSGAKYATLSFADAHTGRKYEFIPLIFRGKVIAVTVLLTKDQAGDLGTCTDIDVTTKPVHKQSGVEECHQISSHVEAVIRTFEDSSHVIITDTNFSLRPLGKSASRAEIYNSKPCEGRK